MLYGPLNWNVIERIMLGDACYAKSLSLGFFFSTSYLYTVI